MTDNTRLFNAEVLGQADNIYDYSPVVGAVGDFAKLDGINVVINSVRNILLTALGFYPFDPEYGSELYKKVFELADDITKDEILFEVRDRVAMFEDRVTITDVEFSLFPNGKGFKVNVYIDREGIPGEVSVYLPGPTGAFGLEDE